MGACSEPAEQAGRAAVVTATTLHRPARGATTATPTSTGPPPRPLSTASASSRDSSTPTRRVSTGCTRSTTEVIRAPAGAARGDNMTPRDRLRHTASASGQLVRSQTGRRSKAGSVATTPARRSRAPRRADRPSSGPQAGKTAPHAPDTPGGTTRTPARSRGREHAEHRRDPVASAPEHRGERHAPRTSSAERRAHAWRTPTPRTARRTPPGWCRGRWQGPTPTYTMNSVRQGEGDAHQPASDST